MMHQLRRHDRKMPDTDTQELLERGEYGILSICSQDGQPYGVPLSYCLLNNALYFHSAPEGRKVSLLAKHNHASFCVIGATQILPEKFSTRYESVIVSGQVTEVEGEEKLQGLEGLVTKYSHEYHGQGLQYIASDAVKTRVFKLSIDTICGKARR